VLILQQEAVPSATSAQKLITFPAGVKTLSSDSVNIYPLPYELLINRPIIHQNPNSKTTQNSKIEIEKLDRRELGKIIPMSGNHETTYLKRYPGLEKYGYLHAKDGEDWSIGHESVVNGMWSAFLAHYFDFPEYLIAPEYRLPDLPRPDLIISKSGQWVTGSNLNNLKILFVEGKKSINLKPGNHKPTGYDINKDVIAQATRYLEEVKQLQTKAGCFGLLVAGRVCAFLQYLDDDRGFTQVRCISECLKVGIDDRLPLMDIVDNAITIHNTLVAIKKKLDAPLK